MIVKRATSTKQCVPYIGSIIAIRKIIYFNSNLDCCRLNIEVQEHFRNEKKKKIQKFIKKIGFFFLFRGLLVNRGKYYSQMEKYT